MAHVAAGAYDAASSALLHALIDDSSLAAAVLQSLTSLRATLETSSSSGTGGAAWSEAAEVATALQSLCQRLRHRASDAQQAQLAISRTCHRPSHPRSPLRCDASARSWCALASPLPLPLPPLPPTASAP